MIFGLFKKRDSDGAADACVCQPSDPAPTQSPFELMKRLTPSGVHEYVALGQCKMCGHAALYYATDVYEDFWQHWCKIDEIERAVLTKTSFESGSDLAAYARAMMERHSHLMQGPVYGYEWVPAGTSVIGGPPW